MEVSLHEPRLLLFAPLFYHFHPSIPHHSSSSPALPLAVQSCPQSILIEVSWGQTIHSCFAIKCEQRRESEEKNGREVKQKKGKDMCAAAVCVQNSLFVHLLYSGDIFPVVLGQRLNNATAMTVNLGGWKDREEGEDEEEEEVWLRSILQPASSSIPLNYCFILPLMRWDLFLSPAPLVSVTFCVLVDVCICMCVSVYCMCDPLMTGSILYNLLLKVRLSVSLSFIMSVSFFFLRSDSYFSLFFSVLASEVKVWTCDAFFNSWATD